jgi:oxygen-independent coproporphyrinogen III oxidase
MAGIYLHIPFCRQACYYCDFHFSTNQNRKAEMVGAMVEELRLQKDFLGNEPVNTIYFGGGTPSLLTEQEVAVLLRAVHLHHSVDPAAEITLEANPDDLTEKNLTAFKQAGINRLSIGIQSFQDDLLTYLHRAHDSVRAQKSFQWARNAGFTNISIDLIYAIPNQHDAKWLHDIEQAIALNPEHISCYSLTIEEKTAFGRWAAAGKLKLVPDDDAASQLEVLIGQLERTGYEHYEISNFSKPGYYSRHNSGYWKQQKYLGIGPSAHSYNGDIRAFTVSNNPLYLRAISSGNVPAETEVLTRENKINEFILTTLRTLWGTNLSSLKKEYQYDLLEQNHAYIKDLIDQGLAILENDTLFLTQKGKFLADKIASELFVHAL